MNVSRVIPSSFTAADAADADLTAMPCMIPWEIYARRCLPEMGAAICEISFNTETTNYFDAGSNPVENISHV